MKLFLRNSLLFALSFVAVERFCHKQTHGFRPYKIYSDHTQSPRWEFKSLSKEKTQEVQMLLKQPFTFLASGGESYVFVSQDQKTVLKVFKHHHMREHTWYDDLPCPTFLSPLRSYVRHARKKRRNQFFTSCKIAYENFREGTGLIYLQLNPRAEWKGEIELYDAIGAFHKFDPNTLPFALQKLATPAYTTLSELMEAGETGAAMTRLASLLGLMNRRYELGIADHDPRKRNFGFIKDKAIELDLGSFSLDPTLQSPTRRRKAFLVETLKLRRWINKYHPTLTDFLEEKIKENIEFEAEIV